MTDTGVVSWAGRAQRFDTAEQVADLCTALKGSDAEEVVLSGNTFSADATEAVAEAMASMQSLRRATLADMFTTRLKTDVPPAIEHLAKTLASLPSVAQVDLSDNALGGPGVAAVAPLLAVPSFTVLSINNCGIGTAGAEVLLHTLSTIDAVALQDLRVARNRLKNDGGVVLAQALAHIPLLRLLQANANSMGGEGMSAILSAVKGKAHLEEMDVNDNNLHSDGVDALLAALPTLPALSSLNLGDCMLDGRVGEVLDAIRLHCPKMTVLDLSYDEIGEEEEAKLIQVAETCPIKTLNVNGNCLKPSTIEKLKEALADGLASLSDNEWDSDDEEDNEEDDVDQLTSRVQDLAV